MPSSRTMMRDLMKLIYCVVCTIIITDHPTGLSSKSFRHFYKQIALTELLYFLHSSFFLKVSAAAETKDQHADQPEVVAKAFEQDRRCVAAFGCKDALPENKRKSDAGCDGAERYS